MAKLAGQLVIKLRVLANHQPLEPDQLKAAAAIWAEELIKAGIPPRLWDEITTLARRARPSSGKAFAVTVDQILDAWEHWLRGEEWSAEVQDWKRYCAPPRYCGQCNQGYIQHEEEIRMSESYTRRRSYCTPCHCEIECSARSSYEFRRFAAAYEVNCGARYEPEYDDLTALRDLLGKIDKPLWDRAVGEWFTSSPADPALEAFCAVSPAFAPIHEERRREAEKERRASEAREEAGRKYEEAERKRKEKERQWREEARIRQEREREETQAKFAAMYPQLAAKYPNLAAKLKPEPGPESEPEPENEECPLIGEELEQRNSETFADEMAALNAPAPTAEMTPAQVR